MVGDEIEHQPQAAILQALTEPRECRIAAEVRMHGVAGDRESGAGDVFLARGRAVSPGTRGATRGLLREICCAGISGLPNAEQPNPVETHRGQAVEFGIGYVVECRAATESCESSVSQTRVLIW